MVTERVVLAIVDALHNRRCTSKQTLDLSESGEGSEPKVSIASYNHALPVNDLHHALLVSYDINDVQGAILWMKLRGYLSAFGWGIMAPEMGYQLTDKGLTLASSRVMPEEDLRRLSGRALFVKPAVYGISLDPKEAWWRVKKFFGRRAK